MAVGAAKNLRVAYLSLRRYTWMNLSVGTVLIVGGGISGSIPALLLGVFLVGFGLWRRAAYRRTMSRLSRSEVLNRGQANIAMDPR